MRDPFREVTLFKRNFDHVVREVYMDNYRDVTRKNPNYFLTYGNGKSAARVQPGLRPNGAHRRGGGAKSREQGTGKGEEGVWSGHVRLAGWLAFLPINSYKSQMFLDYVSWNQHSSTFSFLLFTSEHAHERVERT